MKVVGLTNQQEVMVATRERNFRINEFLIIEDDAQGDVLGEVVEARTYNRFIPMDIGGDFVDDAVIASLRSIGYDINEDTIFIAKVRFFQESIYPVLTGSSVRIPRFDEVKTLIAPTGVEEGLLMGVVRNTKELAEDMGEELKGLLYTLEEGDYRPQEEVPYLLNLRSMHQYPHIGIFGGSGSGKSFGLRVLLEELMEKNIPAIVLDPHYEMDFSYPAEGGKSYEETHKTLKVGIDIGVDFSDLSRGELKQLLSAKSPLTESMENVVDTLYTDGHNYYTFKDRIENLMTAQDEGSLEKIERRMEMAEKPEDREKWRLAKEAYETYNNRVQPASLKGVYWRLRSLDSEGIFAKNSDLIGEMLQLGKLVVIQGSTRIIQVYATYILDRLYRLRRDYKESTFTNRAKEEDFFPPFFIITDESHNFAPKGYESPAKKVIREIAQEGRKYGVFLILATQRPTLLDETVTAQLNTKMIFRTVRASDIDTIREETDLTGEETKRLPYLRTGDVFISSSHMGRTTYGRIRASHTESPHTENPFDELKNRRKEDLEALYRTIEEYLPINAGTSLVHVADALEKKTGKTYTQGTLEGKLNQLVEAGLIVSEKDFLDNLTYRRK